MGLDAVEIIMDVEDHFGISLRNSEVEHVRTVGDLVELVRTRIEASHRIYCPVLAAFRQLRTVVREVAGDDGMCVSPRMRISDCLTHSQVRMLWKRMDALLGASPQSLRRPRALRRLLAVAVVAVVCAAVVSAVMIDFALLPLTLGVAALIAVTLHLLTIPLRVDPPEELCTFGDVAMRLAGTEVATKQLGLRSFDAVLGAMRPIIVDSLGVDPAEVVASARFIDDLGMG